MDSTQGPATAARIPRTLNDIPGWFYWIDQLLFDRILAVQAETAPGHLVELGCFLGKSAVAIGAHQRDGERFVVVDLFERTDLLGEAEDGNRAESARSYSKLTQEGFETNYRALRGTLPEVVVGMSSTVVDHLPAGSVRFMHVDASHLYDAVRGDTESAQTLLRPGGLVVFDDIRSEHTPGTAAAVWEAVATAGLIPVALSQQKLYAVFSGAEPYVAAVEQLLADDDRLVSERHEVAGHRFIRLGESELSKRRKRDQAAARRQAADQDRVSTAVREALAGAQRAQDDAVRQALADARRQDAARKPAAAAQQLPPTPPRLPSRLRRTVTRDLAPPILVRWVRRRRRERVSHG